MSEPERLLRGGGSDFERELLGSLANERPTPALSRRMRQGLVALGLLTSAKTGVAGIVAVVGLVTVGAAGGLWAAFHPSAEPPWPAAVVSAVAARPLPSAPAVETAPPVAPPAPASAVAPRPSAALTAAPSAVSDLREQIAWLDRARASLRAGDSQGALTQLTEYRKRFPRGEFAQEVTVLKIEALVQDGQMDGARALGKKFLAAHPESPHVERIERLIGAAR
ncbi:MAG TPA: tetratricopeptide repeat protein [Polyangiaceae bacterium]|nr:tetratricopeptide repeat protein [Polyangiaceae bacterium]